MAFLDIKILKNMGFKKLGQNVLISEKASIYNPSSIEIGSNVRIDDFCILSPGEGGIVIGNHIHIGCQTTLIGVGKITLEDFSNISSKVSIYSSNDDYSGEWMTNPMVSPEFTNVNHEPVHIGKHVIIGSSSVILPGVSIGHGCSVGCLSLVKESIENGWIVGGVPCKKIKRRSTRINVLESDYLSSSQIVVSVAIPCYNFSQYIKECIQSIQCQITNFNFEIVVSDDFSNDNSLEILKELARDDSRIKIIENDSNLGTHLNIRNLFNSCSGKYIAFLDGDDYFTDVYKLQKQFDFLEANPEYSLHCTGYKRIDDQGNISPEEGLHCVPLKNDVVLEDLLDVNCITFGRMFKKIGGLVADWTHGLEFLDWAINFEILKYGKAKCEEWCSGIYRVSGRGVMTSKSPAEIQESNEKCKKTLQEEFRKYKNSK
jgi:acetyltransferase-like isoleucine patch superfamily enzyme